VKTREYMFTHFKHQTFHDCKGIYVLVNAKTKLSMKTKEYMFS